MASYVLAGFFLVTIRPESREGLLGPPAGLGIMSIECVGYRPVGLIAARVFGKVQLIHDLSDLEQGRANSQREVGMLRQDDALPLDIYQRAAGG